MRLAEMPALGLLMPRRWGPIQYHVYSRLLQLLTILFLTIRCLTNEKPYPMVASRVTASSVLVVVVGCSSPMNQFAPSRSQSSVLRAVTEAHRWAADESSLLFVGEGFTDKTEMFDDNNKRLGTLKAPGGAFAFDRTGTFHDASYNHTSKLEIFRPPYKERKTIWFDTAITNDVAVDPRTGVFAVTLQHGGGAGPSRVELFKSGAVHPCAIVKEPAGVDYITSASAFDREGRLFGVVELNNSDTAIGSIDGECNASSMQINTLPSQDVQPLSGPVFNLDDNLVFQDAFTYTVYKYAHPKNGQFGQPIQSTILTVSGNKGPGLADFRCFAADGKHVWGNVGYPYPMALKEWEYPAGGNPVGSIKIQHAYSCASFPPVEANDTH